MSNLKQEYHKMILDKHITDTNNDVSEYYCPICEYRIRFETSPKRKIILNKGDQYAMHSGGMGGMDIGLNANFEKHNSNENEIDSEIFIPDDDPSLAPWNEWMKNFGNFE